MCFANNVAKPTVAAVAPAPTTGSVVSAADAATAEAAGTAIAQNRDILAKRQGVYGAIKTSPMGDTSYGTSSLGGGYATFGKSRAAA